MRKKRSNRRGYVLVLTLGLVTLAALSLSGLARYSLGLAIQSQEAAEELQRRWGLLSARRVLLNSARDIISTEARPTGANASLWPKPSNVTTTFALGRLNFTVDIADEDSKVNLNTVYARDAERLPGIVRRMCRNVPFRVLGLSASDPAQKAFHSWGQVFDLRSTANPGELSVHLSEVGRTMTCWGSGKLNLQRASDVALREVAALVLSADDIGKLISLRKSWSGKSSDELLMQLDLRQPQRLAASRLLSSDSQNYSLWVCIESNRRNWSYQYVNDGEPVGFAW